MRNYFWICFLLTGLPVLGQQNFASVSFGVSKPVGVYGETGDLEKNGYARTGGAIKFDGGYFPTSYLGIGASFSFNNNYGIRDSVLNDMILYIKENSPAGNVPDYAEIQYGTGFWNNIGLYLGPNLSARLSQRLYIDLRVLGGMTILKPPDQELFISYDITEIHSRINNQKVSFGFTTGGGIRIKLNEGLALRFAVDYSQARARFEYDFNLFELAGDIPALQTDFTVRSLDLTAGLAYAFR